MQPLVGAQVDGTGCTLAGGVSEVGKGGSYALPTPVFRSPCMPRAAQPTLTPEALPGTAAALPRMHGAPVSAGPNPKRTLTDCAAADENMGAVGNTVPVDARAADMQKVLPPRIVRPPASPAGTGSLRAAWPQLKALLEDSTADVERLAAAVATAGHPTAAAAMAAAAAALRRHRMTAVLVLRATDEEVRGLGVGGGPVLAAVRRAAGELCCGGAAGLSASERLLLAAPPRNSAVISSTPGQPGTHMGKHQPAHVPQCGGGGAAAAVGRCAVEGAAAVNPAAGGGLGGSMGGCGAVSGVREGIGPGARRVGTGAPVQLTLAPLRPRPRYDRAAELHEWEACVEGGRLRRAPPSGRFGKHPMSLGDGRDVRNGAEAAAVGRDWVGLGVAEYTWRSAADGGVEGAGERLCGAILAGETKFGKKEAEAWRIEDLDMAAVYDQDADGNLFIVRR